MQYECNVISPALTIRHFNVTLQSPSAAKRVFGLSKWQRRHFTLFPDALEYARKRGGAPAGTLLLHLVRGVQLRTSDDDIGGNGKKGSKGKGKGKGKGKNNADDALKRACTFDITLVDCDRVFTLRASTPQLGEERFRVTFVCFGVIFHW
jgi:hypothetical protein